VLDRIIANQFSKEAERAPFSDDELPAVGSFSSSFGNSQLWQPNSLLFHQNSSEIKLINFFTVLSILSETLKHSIFMHKYTFDVIFFTSNR